ncbi:MAG: SpoIIE family protein phosphatase [Actinomycetia bacterium]|nr:SpoIIE family protein phosphatase [Actinomycetes bacterium]
MDCPACGESTPVDANWCEACGADLAAPDRAGCVACGLHNVSDDGYCMSCGHKQPAERDRVELADGLAVAISDRGLRHHHNEDAVAIGSLTGGGMVLVVCDGVSTTPGSDVASLAAAEAARDLLVSRLGSDDGPTATGAASEGILVAATEVAQAGAAAAATLPCRGRGDAAPSSTFVAVVARPFEVTLQLSVVWMGDSRAYWVGHQASQLTQDHEQDGSLTRWLGADAAGFAPGVAHFVIEEPGMVLVCSDGLWRYADPASELHALIAGLSAKHDSVPELASALVAHAIDGGGHDNISVALWPSAVGPGQQQKADQ